MSNVKLISLTPNAEQLMAYCARVSSNNQDNPNYESLLKYCFKNNHWSVFEHAFMTVEITTSRGISPQLLRHRSFTFQEFSQRYAASTDMQLYEARRQDDKNRQNSIDDMSNEIKEWFYESQNTLNEMSLSLYNKSLELGIAKEQARFLLPLSTTTKLYMTGSIRSWIHYLKLRCEKSTQLEHREIANEIKNIIIKHLPTIGILLDQ